MTPTLTQTQTRPPRDPQRDDRGQTQPVPGEHQVELIVDGNVATSIEELSAELQRFAASHPPSGEGRTLSQGGRVVVGEFIEHPGYGAGRGKCGKTTPLPHSLNLLRLSLAEY